MKVHERRPRQGSRGAKRIVIFSKVLAEGCGGTTNRLRSRPPPRAGVVCTMARMKGPAAAVDEPVEIKVVGKSGQISLGKSYAGKAFRLERRQDGTLVLTAVSMVPESQLWTLQEPHRSRIQRGLTWAAESPPAETDSNDLLKPRGSKAGRKRRSWLKNRIRLDLPRCHHPARANRQHRERNLSDTARACAPADRRRAAREHRAPRPVGHAQSRAEATGRSSATRSNQCFAAARPLTPTRFRSSDGHAAGC